MIEDEKGIAPCEQIGIWAIAPIRVLDQRIEGEGVHRSLPHRFRDRLIDGPCGDAGESLRAEIQPDAASHAGCL
jgi:hypothetical protein